ncbi:CGNR zinc finger domain-containing protein [Micromonospora carbonacea]|uniref:CGNR zinc finger domain-containing protein n=1 Tax=Micromonospora carbonacea TaxID=47853 RepID=UPI003D7225CC
MITSRADRVDAAMDRLRRAGRRTTLARRAVLDALGDAAAERRHLNASEVHQRLTGRGLAAKLSTVHRVLGQPVDLGVAHAVPVGGTATFGLTDQPHHHAVCEGCGGMRQLPVPAVAASVTAVSLANVPLDDTTAMSVVAIGWLRLRDVRTPADLALLRSASRQLREVFAHAGARRDREAVHLLNRLLARHRLRPVIAGTGPADRHLHFAAPGTTPAAESVAAAMWALAVFLCEQGIDRFKTCAEPACGLVFLDVSTNRRRRFCSPRCATRTHVRAHRSRRQAAAH